MTDSEYKTFLEHSKQVNIKHGRIEVLQNWLDAINNGGIFYLEKGGTGWRFTLTDKMIGKIRECVKEDLQTAKDEFAGI